MESAAKTDAKLISRDPDKHMSQTEINRVVNKIGLINHFKLFDASHQRILKKKICINIVETQFFWHICQKDVFTQQMGKTNDF